MSSVRVFFDGFFDEDGVLPDLNMCVFVEFLDRLSLGGGQAFIPLGELFFEVLLVLGLQSLHVLIDVAAEDPLSVFGGVVDEFLVSTLGSAGEALGVMGDVDAAVDSSFQSAEDSVAGGGGNESDVQNGLEGLLALGVVVAHGVVLAVGGGLAGILLVETHLGEQSPGAEQTCRVAGGVVGQPSGQAESLQLVRTCGDQTLVALQRRVDHLADHLRVSDSGHEAVLCRVEFVLVLQGQTLSREVVSLAFPSSAEFGLESLEVGVVFVDLYENHKISI